MARLQLAIFLFSFAGGFCLQKDNAENFVKSSKRQRRSEMHPKLELEMSLVNISTNNETAPGSHFGYSATIKHHTDSMAHAEGVHVLWMLPSFIKYDKLMVWSGPVPKSVFKDDSTLLKFGQVEYGSEVKFTLKVTFDPERTLPQGRRHVVTLTRLTYYDQYKEDQSGKVINKGTLFSEKLVPTTFAVKIPGCLDALGIESKKIEDYQITASSSYADTRPANARPQEDAWCAFETNAQQFIQVDFLKKTRVTKVETFGRKEKYFWVKKYILQYTMDETTWFNYSENGFVKELTGNSDRLTPVYYWLRHPIEAYSVRLWPLEWEKLICLRFELYGCTMKETAGNCIEPLGLESGYIQTEALSHSISDSHTSTNPDDVRLNKKCPNFPFGWQARRGYLDYIQVDLGTSHRVTRIATQGSSGDFSAFFVNAFILKYSNNTLDWFQYKENGSPKTLEGPKTNDEAKYAVVTKLAEPVIARYIRVIPTGSPSLKVMRMELYGCFVEPVPQYSGVPEYARRSYLFDVTSQRFFVCLYSDRRSASSCFSTKDGMNWTAIDPTIISIFAASKDKELFGLDRLMNYYRSRDDSLSWVLISAQHFHDIRSENNLTMSKPIPENLTSGAPTDQLSVHTPGGDVWGVSGTGLHFKRSGNGSWKTVATWKCCGF